MTGRSRLLVLGGVLGIAWLGIEGFSIGLHGWSFPYLAALFGAPGPAQPALGWGALVYAVACTMLMAFGLARRGWCRGDVFVVGALLLVSGLVLLFVGFPVASILTSAARDNAGRFAPDLFQQKLFSPDIWSIACIAGTHACGVAWNTLAQATLVGVLATLLGLAFALLALRTDLPLKPLVRLLSLLPVITPPFVIGLALILLFGRAGHGDQPARRLRARPAQPLDLRHAGHHDRATAGVHPDRLPGPHRRARCGQPEPRGSIADPARQPLAHLRTITWPLIRPGLANAFLISFIESLADFANPLIIGGNFNVLATDIYFAVVGAAHDQGRAAVLSLVLLAFTLSAFMAQRAWTGRHNYTTVTGKGDAGISPLPAPLRAACYAAVLPWLVLTVVVYGIILAGGFVVTFGRDYTPTLEYFWTAFSIERGVAGWFLSGSGWRSFITTMELALLSMPVTAALGLLTAWLLDRQRFAGRTAFEFLAMMSFAIPGTVVGVSYILAFNVPPVALTGTSMIIIISFVFRNMPVGIRAGMASLSQIDPSLDEASQTLGARSFRTLRLVLLPILRPAVVTAMVYSFVRAVTTVSAVIFLVSGEYNLATVYIVGRADVGEYGVALAYSAVLIVVMAVVLVGISALVGEQRIGRRGIAAAQPVMVQA